MRSIIKEILIIILLIIIIFLLAAVMFYEYMPISIAVPENVKPYVTSSEVKEEISEEIVEHSKQTQTFEISESDLKDYQKSNYDASKESPFLPNYDNYYIYTDHSATKQIENDVVKQAAIKEDKKENTEDKNQQENNENNENEESNKAATTHDTKIK